MSALLLLSFLLAAVAAAATAGVYLAWPRRMSAEEWVLHRREAAVGRPLAQPRVAAELDGGRTRWAARLWLIGLVRADLRLLQLRGQSPAAGEVEFVAGLLRTAAVGAGVGLVGGLGIWVLSGPQGAPAPVLLLPVACGALLPGLRWLRFRRQAEELRAAVRRRLPRLLTGARVLMESGAVTPHMALSSAVAIYSDTAAVILRDALLDQEVRRVELQDALDQEGRTYGLEELRRLADAYRVGTRQGTQMADLLSEFALDLRRAEHAAYRERMTRAPVLMTLPALVFFVLPLLALVLLLVFAPLAATFSQL